MTSLSSIVRAKSDPKVLQTGPSSLSWSDRLGRNLGWFSIGLGIVEVCAPRMLTRTLGLHGKEPLVRAYGAREIAAGIVSLSVDKKVGLWSRLAGDALDLASLMPALDRFNPRRGNAKLATAAVVGITLIDIYGAVTQSARHRRTPSPRSYKDKSGFPQGVASARGTARYEKPARPSTAAATNGQRR